MGAVDPTSGTATLLEITRVLGDMKKNGEYYRLALGLLEHILALTQARSRTRD